MTPSNDELTDDYRDFIAALNTRGAEFIVVGAYAVGLQGFIRGTQDIDLLIRSDIENARRVVQAVKDFIGVDVDPNELAKEKSLLVLGREPNRIDVLTSITGVSWERAWKERIPGRIEDQDAAFLSKECLIDNKTASGAMPGRGQDRVDVENLKLIPTEHREPPIKK